MAVCDTLVFKTKWQRAAPCVGKLTGKCKLNIMRANKLLLSIYSLTNILCTHCMPTISVFVRSICSSLHALRAYDIYLLFLLFPCDQTLVFGNVQLLRPYFEEN